MTIKKNNNPGGEEKELQQQFCQLSRVYGKSLGIKDMQVGVSCSTESFSKSMSRREGAAPGVPPAFLWFYDSNWESSR